MVLNEKEMVSKFDKKFIKNYDEASNKGYNLEVDVEYPKDLHNLNSNLPFLLEKIAIKKLVCNLYDKREDVVELYNKH